MRQFAPPEIGRELHRTGPVDAQQGDDVAIVEHGQPDVSPVRAVSASRTFCPIVVTESVLEHAV